MAKKPYSEQLKHPFWQRKRLEVLEASEWRCERCAAAEKTLHVHHKHYVKGREVWDYERTELEALCEDCHEEAHKDKALIDQVIAQFPSVMWSDIASVLVGYGDEHVDPAFWLQISEERARAGQVAWYMGNLSPADAREAAQVLKNTDPDTFMEMVRARAQEQQELLDAMERFDAATKNQPPGSDQL